MIIVGGDDWTSAFGASAITNEGVFKTAQLDKIFFTKRVFTRQAYSYND